MEYRQLGFSGLKVSVLGFGAGTFGGSNAFFQAWGRTETPEATRLVSICAAQETGKTVPQIALNWLLGRPTVASIILGARNEEQLKQNLAAFGWKLTPSQTATLDAASAAQRIYPYWHQVQFKELNPPPV